MPSWSLCIGSRTVAEDPLEPPEAAEPVRAREKRVSMAAVAVVARLAKGRRHSAPVSHAALSSRQLVELYCAWKAARWA